MQFTLKIKATVFKCLAKKLSACYLTTNCEISLDIISYLINLSLFLSPTLTLCWSYIQHISNLKFLFKCWRICWFATHFSLTFLKKFCRTQNSWWCFKQLKEGKEYGLVLFLLPNIFLVIDKQFKIFPNMFLLNVLNNNSFFFYTYMDFNNFTFVKYKLDLKFLIYKLKYVIINVPLFPFILRLLINNFFFSTWDIKQNPLYHSQN